MNDPDNEVFESRLRPEPHWKRTTQFLSNQMNQESPNRKQFFSDTLGYELAGGAHAHRYLNTVSPNKMRMQDLASG
jgi:hypothetical protein